VIALAYISAEGISDAITRATTRNSWRY
jgi:hypothetical protein